MDRLNMQARAMNGELGSHAAILEHVDGRLDATDMRLVGPLVVFFLSSFIRSIIILKHPVMFYFLFRMTEANNKTKKLLKK